MLYECISSEIEKTSTQPMADQGTSMSEKEDIPPPPPVGSPRGLPSPSSETSPRLQPRSLDPSRLPVDPIEVGRIDTIRRVSEIRVQAGPPTSRERNAENIYIETIRRVSGVNAQELRQQAGEGARPPTPTGIEAGRNLSENIIIRNKGASTARIVTCHKLSSSEIGVIEAVRRISGVNAAIHELTENAPDIRMDVRAVVAAQTGGVLGIEEKKLVEAQPATGKVKGAKPSAAGLGDKDWHLMSEEEILTELKSGLKGRLALHGPPFSFIKCTMICFAKVVDCSVFAFPHPNRSPPLASSAVFSQGWIHGTIPSACSATAPMPSLLPSKSTLWSSCFSSWLEASS